MEAWNEIYSVQFFSKFIKSNEIFLYNGPYKKALQFSAYVV